MIHWLFGSPASVMLNDQQVTGKMGHNTEAWISTRTCFPAPAALGESMTLQWHPIERPAVLRGPQSCLSLVSGDAGKWTVFLWLWKSPRLSRSNIYKVKSSINGSFRLLGWFLGAHQVVSPHDQRLTSALGIKIWIKNKVPIEPRFFLTKLLDSA